jgi:hypothetical protein
MVSNARAWSIDSVEDGGKDKDIELLDTNGESRTRVQLLSATAAVLYRRGPNAKNRIPAIINVIRIIVNV